MEKKMAYRMSKIQAIQEPLGKLAVLLDGTLCLPTLKPKVLDNGSDLRLQLPTNMRASGGDLSNAH